MQATARITARVTMSGWLNRRTTNSLIALSLDELEKGGEVRVRFCLDHLAVGIDEVAVSLGPVKKAWTVTGLDVGRIEDGEIIRIERAEPGGITRLRPRNDSQWPTLRFSSPRVGQSPLSAREERWDSLASPLGIRRESRRHCYNPRVRRMACTLLALVFLAGCRSTTARESAVGVAAMAFTLRSSAFAEGTAIPRQYTCDSADQSPPLSWTGVPAGTKSLALIVEDPDAPSGNFVHWVLFNIPPEPVEIAAGTSHQTVLASGARQGRNDFRRVGYGGPCPPSGPAHRYFFRMLALDEPLDLTPGATASEVRSAAKGHTLGQAEVIGTYGRP